jgi:hypothetical protein
VGRAAWPPSALPAWQVSLGAMTQQLEGARGSVWLVDQEDREPNGEQHLGYEFVPRTRLWGLLGGSDGFDACSVNNME